jgi:hypothetical protein
MASLVRQPLALSCTLHTPPSSKPYNRTLLNIPRGEAKPRGAERPLSEPAPAYRAMPYRRNHPHGNRQQRQGLPRNRPPGYRLPRRRTAGRAERRPRAGRGVIPTECALTHYPLAGLMLCGFAIRQNERRSHPATPKTDRASQWRFTANGPGYRREPPTWQGEASRPPLHPPRKARAEIARQP